MNRDRLDRTHPGDCRDLLRQMRRDGCELNPAFLFTPAFLSLFLPEGVAS
jgi:hypothetical protein